MTQGSRLQESMANLPCPLSHNRKFCRKVPVTTPKRGHEQAHKPSYLNQDMANRFSWQSFSRSPLHIHSDSAYKLTCNFARVCPGCSQWSTFAKLGVNALRHFERLLLQYRISIKTSFEIFRARQQNVHPLLRSLDVP